jgi:hypothetical protein
MKGSVIFKKGKVIYYGGNVKHSGDGEKKTYYEVEDIESEKIHIVIFEVTKNGVVASCDCISKSLHIDKPTFCSHILACIYKIYHEVKHR